MSEIYICEPHGLNYVVYCAKCEQEFRDSGRYQAFLERELARALYQTAYTERKKQ